MRIGHGFCQPVATSFQALYQSVAVNTLDRILARHIDRRHEDHVGIVEGALKFFHMVAQAGEAVRLNHGDHTPFGAFAGS